MKKNSVLSLCSTRACESFTETFQFCDPVAIHYKNKSCQFLQKLKAKVVFLGSFIEIGHYFDSVTTQNKDKIRIDKTIKF